jgi:hypothetical protein
VNQGAPRHPEFPILANLRADGPHLLMRDKLEAFGQFVGTWDMSVEFYDDGGNCIYREPGEWAFAWVLDGRAIQDVLTYPRADETGVVRGIGTSLRFYDRRSDVWQVIWLGAVTGIIVVLSGGPDSENIRLEGPDPDGTLNRWVFTEITTQRFVWKGFESRDGGNTWLLQQLMIGARRDRILPGASLP